MSTATLFWLRLPWAVLLAAGIAGLAYLATVVDARVGSRAISRRRLERVSLILILLPVVSGLLLVFLAKARDFDDVESRIQKGQLLDLRHVQSPSQLRVFLSFIESDTERTFVADQMYAQLRVAPSNLPNVGALSRLAVTDAVIDATAGLATFKNRLDDSRASRPAVRQIGLLSPAQIQAAKPSFVVRTPADFRRDFVVWVSVALACLVGLHLIWSRIRFTGDQFILPPLFALSGIALMLMTSLRDPLRDVEIFVPFAQGIAGGCGVLLIASIFDIQRRFSRLTFVPLASSLALSLGLLAFGSGPGSSDAKVNLGPVQPIELMRLCLILFFAGYFGKRWQFLRDLRERRQQLARLTRRLSVPKLDHVLPVLGCIALSLLFFYLQRDLGPALIVACLFLSLHGIARGRFLLAGTAVMAIVSGMAAGAWLGFPRTVAGRVQMFLSPWDNDVRGGDQLSSSLWALSSNGALGSGLGLGEPADVPAAHTDMILAVVGEELGLVGLIAVFVCWGLLLYRGRKIAVASGSPYAFFLVCGCVLATAFQVALIAGGVFGVMPLSGVVSPFLSFGRSALLANFALAGILVSVSTQRSESDVSAWFRPGVRIVSCVVVAVLAALLSRAFYIQVWSADSIAAAAVLIRQQDGVRRFQYNPRLTAFARALGRGTIRDRNGIPVASSAARDIEEHRADYRGLGVDPDEALRHGGRFYPFGAQLFHVLGDVRTRRNWSARNAAYVERDFEDHLVGFDMTSSDERPAAPNSDAAPAFRDYRPLVHLFRQRYDPNDSAPARMFQGNRSLGLTIDAPFTVRITGILRRRLGAAGLLRGAVVVLDAESGGILASVSLPEPGDLPATSTPDREGETFDRARFGLYPPGSVFKLVTAAAALRVDTANSERVYICQRLPDGRAGSVVRGEAIRDDITDAHPHGAISMKAAIAESCNGYFAHLATDLGSRVLFETAARLGIRVAAPNTASELAHRLPQAGFGQGEVLASPLQIAALMAMIANDGRLHDTHLVKEAGVRNEPDVVLGPVAARAIAEAMRFAVTDGTGRAGMTARIPIAGKTGTAEVEGNPSHAWFAGFAPYGGRAHRRIAFAVLAEHGRYGGTVAAPIAAEVVNAAAALGILR